MQPEQPKTKSKKWFYIILFNLIFDILLVLIFATPYLLPSINYNRSFSKTDFKQITEESPEDLKLIREGNQKILKKDYENPKWSICYVHGFTASPQEIEPVISNLAHQLKANLFMTRLTGHGLKDPTPMGKVSPQQWINDTIDCLNVAKKMGQKTILIGMSFGGTLATLVTENYPIQPDVLILLSPNFGLDDPMAFLLAGVFGKQIAQINFGMTREYKTVNEAHRKYWSYRHPAAALKSFMILTRKIETQDHQLLQVPTFILYSEKEDVVSLKKILDFYAKIAPIKKDIFTTPSFNNHVLAGELNPQANVILQENLYEYIQGLDESF